MTPDDNTIETIKRLIPPSGIASAPGQLMGWMTQERAIQLYRILRALKPRIAVEIGVFGGRSLIPQALAMRDNGGGRAIGLDSWKNADAMEAGNDPTDDPRDIEWWGKCDLHGVHRDCMEHIWRLGLDKWITIIRSTSQDAAYLIPGMDCLTIDGNHSEISSCRDVSLFLPKLHMNGYLFFDDADWPQTQKALKMVEKQCKLVSDNASYRVYAKGEPLFQTNQT
jgi:hypothetical protein